MTVLTTLVVPAFLVCAAASPTSRRTFGQWTRGAWHALTPRNVLMGCGLWLLLGWLIGAVILCGWVALVAVSPVLAVVDVIDLAGRRKAT